MKRLIIATGIVALLAAGCFKKDSDGIGVIPLEGAKVSGKVIEATSGSGVLLKTDGQRDALLPDTWTYHNGDRVVEFGHLQPGHHVTAIAPRDYGRLVAAPGKNLVLSSGGDTFTLPYEAFPVATRSIPVNVQTVGGQRQVLPLNDAIYSDQYTVLSHPYYSDYNFPKAAPNSIATAYMVGQYENQPLALVPGPDGLQAVSLPTNYYPAQSFSTNQPVRFNYDNGNVRVSSWNTLQDGQIDLTDVLLAGTLLKILPGEAVVQVGQQPFTVPRSYIYHDGSPVAWNNISPGAPIDVRYLPGVYDVVNYSTDNFTLAYNNQIVQLPVRYVPEHIYQQPVVVRYQDGRQKRLPYGQAKKLYARNECRFVTHGDHRRIYKSWVKNYNKEVAKAYKHAQPMVFGAVAQQMKFREKKPKRNRYQAWGPPQQRVVTKPQKYHKNNKNKQRGVAKPRKHYENRQHVVNYEPSHRPAKQQRIVRERQAKPHRAKHRPKAQPNKNNARQYRHNTSPKAKHVNRHQPKGGNQARGNNNKNKRKKGGRKN